MGSFPSVGQGSQNLNLPSPQAPGMLNNLNDMVQIRTAVLVPGPDGKLVHPNDLQSSYPDYDFSGPVPILRQTQQPAAGQPAEQYLTRTPGNGAVNLPAQQPGQPAEQYPNLMQNPAFNPAAGQPAPTPIPTPPTTAQQIASPEPGVQKLIGQLTPPQFTAPPRVDMDFMRQPVTQPAPAPAPILTQSVKGGPAVETGGQALFGGLTLNPGNGAVNLPAFQSPGRVTDSGFFQPGGPPTPVPQPPQMAAPLPTPQPVTQPQPALTGDALKQSLGLLTPAGAGAAPAPRPNPFAQNVIRPQPAATPRPAPAPAPMPTRATQGYVSRAPARGAYIAPKAPPKPVAKPTPKPVAKPTPKPVAKAPVKKTRR